MKKNSEIPFIIQKTEKPAFIGENPCSSQFICEKCGNLLIDNYDQSQFIQIGIQCFKCDYRNITPTLEAGEIFSQRIVNLGEAGNYLITDTVIARSGAAMTCSQAISEASKLTHPQSEGRQWDLTEESLDELILEYDEITNNKFKLQSKILQKGSDKDIPKYPFAWSLNYIKNAIISGKITISDRHFAFSCALIKIFCEVLGRWQHHPRFKEVAFGLGKESQFLHTCGQFIIADYLFNQGMVIGLSKENISNEPNPDLYLRISNSKKLYLEVKSPQALHNFPSKKLDTKNIKKSIDDCIHKSKNQINKNRPGSLVIFSSLEDFNQRNEISKSIENNLKNKGFLRKSLHSVLLVSIEKYDISFNSGKFDQEVMFKIEVFNNEKFIFEL